MLVEGQRGISKQIPTVGAEVAQGEKKAAEKHPAWSPGVTELKACDLYQCSFSDRPTVTTTGRSSGSFRSGLQQVPWHSNHGTHGDSGP